MQLNEEERAALLALARAHARWRLPGAEELADDIAGIAWRRLTSVSETPDSYPDLMRRLVDNDIATHFRRQNARIRGSRPVMPEAQAVMFFVGAAQFAVPAGAADAISQQEVWNDIADSLEERHRQVIRCMADGMTHPEIAARLGYANANVVKVTVSRLRQRLRQEYALRAGVDGSDEATEL